MTDTPASKTSIPRLRSVRFRDGGADLRLLNAEVDEKRQHVEACVRAVLDEHTAESHIAGFAFVVWNTDGQGNCDYSNMDSHVATALIPDFVRTHLMLEMVRVHVSGDD